MCVYIYTLYIYTYIYISPGAVVTCRYYSSGLTSRYASVKRAGTKEGKETSRCIASHRGEDPRAATYRERYNIFRFSFVGGRSGDSVCILSAITCIYILTLRLSGAAPRRVVEKWGRKLGIIRERGESGSSNFRRWTPSGNFSSTLPPISRGRSPPIFAILYIVHHSIGH